MRKGFTLIELLIVITIIGILSVAFVPQLLNAPSQARDTARIDAAQLYAGGLTGLAIDLGSVHINGGEDDEQLGFPNNGCLVNYQVPARYLPLFGGQPPGDPDPENVLPPDPGGHFEGQSDPEGVPFCAGGFGILIEPRANDTDPIVYDFGIYSHVENMENANSKCSTAYLGVMEDPDETTPETDYCYAILVAL